MTEIISKPNVEQKLRILSTDAQYDLACACGTKNPEEHRTRSGDGKWIYPVSLPNGGSSVIFKTLLSNVCSNDCKYCPLRDNQDIRRCTLTAEETVNVFLDYLNRKKVFGLFLSSGVIGTPDNTMQRLNAIARLLRYKHKFRGYIHLKVIPGASTAAIEEAVSLSSAVSLNIETPGEKYLGQLSNRKNFIQDIVEPIKLISRLTAKGSKHQRVRQTTQFIVGAAEEPDRQIVKYMGGLYTRLGLQRIYFSAYQKLAGAESLPAESGNQNPSDMLTREHRLYQVDFLMRKYGFNDSEFEFEQDGQLNLNADPKEIWAQRHPEFFPININRADKYELLRVPGLGPVTVSRILQARRQSRLWSLDNIGKIGKRLGKAQSYIKF